MDKKNKSNNKIIIAIILILLILDQVTKIIFLQIGRVTVPEESENSQNGYYIIMSIIIVIMILKYMQNNNTFIKLGTKIVLSLAVAGAIGNAIDRIWNGYVITFINIKNFANMNLAYIYILATWFGMAGILAKNSMTFLKERKIKNTKEDKK